MLMPIYSHGGSDAPGWPAVKNPTANGRPISVIGSSSPMAFMMIWQPTRPTDPVETITVTIDCNGGVPGPTGAPPDAEWIDCLPGAPLTLGYSATVPPGNVLNWAKKVIPSVPFWRTRIISQPGRGTFLSYIAAMRIVTPGGIMVTTASYPANDNVGTKGM